MSLPAARELSRLPALNAGCGPVRLEDAVGVDRDPSSCADVIHDLDRRPWPFPDGRFERVVLSHVIEHLEDPDGALREAHRLCRAGGEVVVVTPHFSSYESYGDITHRWHLGLAALKPYYAPSRGRPLFQLASRSLGFSWSPLCWPGRVLFLLNAGFYEKYFCWIFPARNMEFRLRAVK